MKAVILILSLFVLVGCGRNTKPETIIEYVSVPVECEDFGRIAPIKPLPIVFVEGTTKDGFKVLGLRGDQYSNLAINNREAIRYISEQKKAISYYKTCIETHNLNTQN